MNTIRENDFSRVDLNLLTVLLVLYREGSVSRAAEKLHLGQPAVSGALARLREMFQDPLFVRSAKGMTPTPRAQSLVDALAPMMQQMQHILFQSPTFSPASDRHTFRLGMSDWVESWLMPGLLTAIAREAPGVNLQITATDPFQDAQLVQQDKVDVAISVAEATPAGLHREILTSMGFRSLWHPQQLALNTPLAMNDFVACEHVLVSYRGATQSMLDEKLSAEGYQRRIRYVTPHFSCLPLMLTGTPVLATVPQGLAAGWEQHYGLCSSETPLELPNFELSLLWHKRQERDPALQWLLKQLRGLVTS